MSKKVAQMMVGSIFLFSGAVSADSWSGMDAGEMEAGVHYFTDERNWNDAWKKIKGVPDMAKGQGKIYNARPMELEGRTGVIIVDDQSGYMLMGDPSYTRTHGSQVVCKEIDVGQDAHRYTKPYVGVLVEDTPESITLRGCPR